MLEQLPPTARHLGPINWMGLRTLYMKEVRRFMRVGPQTLLAPIISNLLYMTVFVLAFSALRPDPQSFMAFLAPGLVMLGILNNAAANSSSSIMTGKMMGSITDVLMPPLSPTELALGWIGGAATRGVLVAVATALALSIFTPLIPTHVWAVFYFGLSAAVMMAMVGVLSGIWAEKFDQLAVVNQFIILPLSFLSGTFYKIDVLPGIFQDLIKGNPLFYLIDGFRYGFTGEADGNLLIGVVFIAALNIALFLTVLLVLRAGWRIKS
ncbi:transport permease protein [Algimonas ampicilliniresistens]|uniref:Transport permease protein n=1 Tax=Algimonas ampicilliniresistens TaxID=1298735 RepID=A0ABQ5VBL9_9PROT|nr:ABC transporter permease [Algimonas ampicilliniresistens]GLQ24430.1 transport permease protein [Algimonas ampicilliniresistens]